MSSIKSANHCLKLSMAIGLLTHFAAAAEPVQAQSSAKLSANDSWYVALERCGENAEGVLASKVNMPDSNPVCFAPVQTVSSADAATQAAIVDIANAGGTELIRVETKDLPTATIKQVFTVIAPPANPLELPVDRLQYYQASATDCSGKAIFSFTTVNGKQTQRGWGERDVRINPVYELPTEWTLEKLRNEILFEGASFRGIVERPTFDILHPFAERPLLVTVFDLLPLVRSTERCPLSN